MYRNQSFCSACWCFSIKLYKKKFCIDILIFDEVSYVKNFQATDVINDNRSCRPTI